MRVFFIGICGTAMGNVAILLKKQGHEVAGSDSGIYPPMSDVLKDSGIELFEDFRVEILTNWGPDRVVVGNAVTRGNPQVEFVLRTRSFPFVSLPELIGNDLIKQRPSLVVCGTHGKTTTTSLAAFAMSQVGLDPGYLVGGVPLDLPSGNQLGHEDSPFVIEGDEYDSAFFDKRSKFIHYRPRVLILNNLEFDHGDIFRDLQDISRSFSHLLRIVPDNGFILVNGDDENISALPESTWCKTFKVGFGERNDLRIEEFLESQNGVSFNLTWHGSLITEIKWQMPGEFNARNLAMSFIGSILCQAIYKNRDIDPNHPFVGCDFPDYSNCLGVKRRQEVLVENQEMIVISDFGHHPTAIDGTLRSLRARWGNRKITACFEPRSNTAVTNIFQDRFTDALSLADQVLIGPVHRGEKIPSEKRISPSEMVRKIEGEGKKGYFFDENLALLNFLKNDSVNSDNNLIVFFSNGSFDGVIENFSKYINEK